MQPGYAWDGFGRPIVVAEPAKLSPALLSSFDAMFAPGGGPPPASGGGLAPVRRGPQVRALAWLRDLRHDVGLRWVTERFALEVGPRNEAPTRRDPIQIAGRSMDAAEALRPFDPAAAELADAERSRTKTLPEEGDSRSGCSRWGS